MTCFWDGLLRELNANDKKMLMSEQPDYSYRSLIKGLKARNRCVSNVLWQGEKLTHKIINENVDHIKNYDTNSAKGGYLMSSFDPFMVLICSLLRVDIEFEYNNNKIRYVCTTNHRRRKLNFRASTSHFY